jgi:Flp pilus assembly protein TadB
MRSIGLALAFVSVTLGTYGLLRQIALLGLWPIRPRPGRTLFRELTSRLGSAAAAQGWFGPLRRGAHRDLSRARFVDQTPDDVVGESVLYAVGGFFAGWLLTALAGGAVWNVIPAAVVAFVLFSIPEWNLKSAAHRRITGLTQRLPYSLEVIVLATEAGASFEEALAILVREDPRSPLHEEFDQVLRDMHLGLTRREALHAMAARTGTDDVASLVMAMDVAEDLGTPVASSLRKQSNAIQAARLQRAERLSHEAGPKMAVPNTMIMMANVILILAPFIPKLTAVTSL